MQGQLNARPYDTQAAARYRRPIDEDFDVLAAIRRDRFTQALLLSIPDRTDDIAVQEWIDRRSSEPGGVFLTIADVATNEALGFAQVANVHRRNRTGYAGMALHSAARGRGIGEATWHYLIRFAATTLHLRKLLAEVRSDNEASIRMNLSAGYRQCGALEKHFMDAEGGAHDVLIFERFLTTDDMTVDGPRAGI